jgi:hypothetical protein
VIYDIWYSHLEYQLYFPPRYPSTTVKAKPEPRYPRRS